MSLKEQISTLHYQPWQPWLSLFLPLEAAYRWAVQRRLETYEKGWLKPFESPVPVISVGNLTTGGTGKTPMVIALAQGLLKAGKKVVVLSRGYGAAEPVTYQRATTPQWGDEAYLMQTELPDAVVIVGRDRVHTLQQAIHDYQPDYVLLDDGFQYLRLARTINILLIDGEKGFGNGHLLPVGPLREPLAQIRRADLIFVTQSVDAARMEEIQNLVAGYCPSPIPILPVPFHVSGLQNIQEEAVSPEPNQSVVALSAIAQPDRFERDIAGLGLQLVRHFRFSDHHVYRPLDVETVLYQINRHPQKPWIVTTQKDLPKLKPLLPDELLPLVHTLKIAPALDGQWFYQEFLTQMPEPNRATHHHAPSAS